jgi:hypothetical protein
VPVWIPGTPDLKNQGRDVSFHALFSPENSSELFFTLFHPPQPVIAGYFNFL